MLVNSISISPCVHYVLASDSVEFVRNKMLSEEGASELVVTDFDNEILGIVTGSDLIRVKPDMMTSTSAREICSHPLLSVEAEDTVQKAAQLMLDNKCHHIVVFEEGNLKGILSSHDLVKYLHDTIA